MYDLASAHVFEKGVVFVASEYDEYNLKFHDNVASTVPEYDIFFWDRGYGQHNLTELNSRFERIQPVTVDTMVELHQYAQANSTHDYYYVITSDTTVTENFNFDYEFEFSMTETNRQQIVVWQKTDWEDNVLEYHGVGLFRKDYELFTENKYQRFDFRRKALYQETNSIKPERYDIAVVNDLLDEEFYGDLRKSQRGGDSVPVTARQLESLIRIAEARARMDLRQVVTQSDAEDAVAVVK